MKRRLLTIIAALLFIGTATMAQSTPAAADSVLKKACENALQQNKNVMVIFHASWCGWCKKMEASINDPSCKKMFDDNYVICYLDVLEHGEKVNLENPGALDMLKKYKGEKSGLPFWLIFNTKGMLLKDSQISPVGAGPDVPGDNIACPATEKEIAYFTDILKATSKLNSADLTVIAKRFLQNQSAR